jgi:NAD(P)-dependent dehydrogenase (short-subunit alcohol dehydrogenase family)
MTHVKTILITGAGRGIGKEAARQLALQGHRLVLVTRTESSGESARKEIVGQTGNHNIDVIAADLSSVREIHRLSAEIHKRHERLDVLVNNAGVFVTRYLTSGDGFEMQWAVNHLAPFLLTGLLLPLLERSAPSRIITVSSMANFKGVIHFEDPDLRNDYNGLTAYRQSKLANVLFTFELARKLQQKNITANCLHPGIVRTSFGHRNNWSWMGLLWFSYKPFMLTVEQGAYCLVRLAGNDALDGVSGKYFDYDGRERVPNKIAFDISARERLWKVSEDQTGFSWND